MKVLMIKDVYNLGRAGDIKKVADGYGRNYLLPQGLAVLATAGALKQVEKIREEAVKRRAVLNEEMGAVAEVISKITLAFAAKAGETGKLYGSITTQDVASAIKEKSGVEIKRQQIDIQPIRALGEYAAHIRLTMDLIPDVKIIVYREGEANPIEAASEATPTPVAEPAPIAETAPAAEPVAAETPAEEPTAEEISAEESEA